MSTNLLYHAFGTEPTGNLRGCFVVLEGCQSNFGFSTVDYVFYAFYPLSDPLNS